MSDIMQLTILLSFVVTASSEVVGAEGENKCEGAEDQHQHGQVLHASVVRLRSDMRKCVLANSPKFYPIRYENGRGSSYQSIVGCHEDPGSPLDLPYDYRTAFDQTTTTWQVALASKKEFNPDQVGEMMDDFDPDEHIPIRNGDLVQLLSWGPYRQLNSHDVVAPISISVQEVSGYIDHHVGMDPEVIWKLVLPYPAEVWKVNMEGVQLVHMSTGKVLSISEKRYPEWGVNMTEVVTADLSKSGHSSWTVDLIRYPRYTEYFDDQFYDELYNLGTSENTTDKVATTNNTSSSTADLKILTQTEISLLKEVLERISKDDLNLLLKEDGYDINIIENTDVLNPLDCYNLIKRTSRTWSKIRDTISKYENMDKEFIIGMADVLRHFPRWEESRIASALGLLNVQLYYNLDPGDLMNGKLRDNVRNITYQAVSRLKPEDVKLIATTAKNENNLKSQITWLRATPELHKQYRKAVKLHNNLLAKATAELVKESWVMFDETVDESLPLVEDIRNYLTEGRKLCPPFQDSDHQSNQNCIEYFWSQEIKRLCQGDQTQRPAVHDTDTKCELLDYANPYLRLGPFHLEHRNTKGNYVAQIHSVVTEKEMEDVRNKTKGQMKATPYTEAGKKTNNFSYKRTSKIKYISERNDIWAEKMSRRLELATGYKLYDPDYRFAAENYQIMNYGYGGTISLHMDATKDISDSGIGGGRLTTAMLYLSDVESGGFTIFPKLGLYIVPEAGSLLFWSVRRSNGDTDSRMHHLGCPVLYGDKWIGNKWIRWEAQMNKFKCLLHKGINFPPNSLIK